MYFLYQNLIILTRQYLNFSSSCLSFLNAVVVGMNIVPSSKDVSHSLLRNGKKLKTTSTFSQRGLIK